MTRGRVARACLLLLLWLPAAAAGAPELSLREIHDVWRARLDGRHFAARVRMTVQIDSQEEERLLRIWRDDVDQRERLYARFDSPYDLRNLAILYIENTDRDNDYFMYQPSTQRIRRISHGVARRGGGARSASARGSRGRSSSRGSRSAGSSPGRARPRGAPVGRRGG